MIVAAGESLVDLLVTPAGGVTALPGGGPFNVARTVARLGQPVSFIGRLSTDTFGRQLRARLEADGVDLSRAPTTDDPTLLAVAEIGADGNATYRFHTAGTAAAGLAAADVEAAAWTGAARGRDALSDPAALSSATAFGVSVSAWTVGRAGAEPPSLADLGLPGPGRRA